MKPVKSQNNNFIYSRTSIALVTIYMHEYLNCLYHLKFKMDLFLLAHFDIERHIINVSYIYIITAIYLYFTKRFIYLFFFYLF